MELQPRDPTPWSSNAGTPTQELLFLEAQLCAVLSVVRCRSSWLPLGHVPQLCVTVGAAVGTLASFLVRVMRFLLVSASLGSGTALPGMV